ncbi:hypothetical protein JCM19235_1242 [Vibrio maritimus]|uniref:Phage protein n=1 Tax=Vibrio maritimus TaxID=990268 RepID=A0A090S5X9_9VIBR|nr:hypothetical protein JCM19235_1242 [Vibrio maritimus]
MKLLNLDELVGNKRPVVLNGTTYYIHEQTVGQLIEAVNSSRALNGDDPLAMFEALVATAKQAIPDAPDEEIRALNMTQLQALIAFVNASETDLVEATAGDDEGK